MKTRVNLVELWTQCVDISDIKKNKRAYFPPFLKQKIKFYTKIEKKTLT